MYELSRRSYSESRDGKGRGSFGGNRVLFFLFSFFDIAPGKGSSQVLFSATFTCSRPVSITFLKRKENYIIRMRPVLNPLENGLFYVILISKLRLLARHG